MTGQGEDDRRVMELLQAVLQKPSAERAGYLRMACNGNENLRHEVADALSWEERMGDFLQQPIAIGVKANTTLDSEVTRALPITAGLEMGQYRIESRLGEGGMSKVYLAFDTRLGRRVAIKFLSDDVADAEARRRFQHEAQMASSLNHPHIITVHDVGEFHGRQYLVTEYVDGGTLGDWAKEKKRTPKEVAELLAGVADGLAAAHQAGILHRDIKPTNILVARNGYAKLADFGLAKLAENSKINTGLSLSEGQTGRGLVLGTVAYMSPEQAMGEPLDTRSDIFSFGIVMHETFSEKRPFRGRSDLEILRAIVEGQPEPLSNDLPVTLRNLVEKSLEKAPSERYQSMREVVVDLRRGQRQQSLPIEPKASTKTISWAVFLLLGAMGIAYLIFHRDTAMPFQDFKIDQITNSGNYVEGAISPDGKSLLSSVKENGNKSIWLRNIPTDSNIQVIAPAEASDYGFTFSCDGNYIYFHNPSAGIDRVSRVPVFGGAPQVVVRGNSSAVTFSPDCTRMAYMRWDDPRHERFSLLTSNLDGTNERVIKTGAGSFVPNVVAWAPAGNQLAFTMTGPGHGRAAIQLLDLASLKIQTLARFEDRPITSMVWSRDRRGLLITFDKSIGFMSRSQIGFVSNPSGQFRPITNDTNDYGPLTLSADGKTLATIQRRVTQTFYLTPASGFSGVTPNPAKAQSKDAAMFGWAFDSEHLYFGDGGNLLRMLTDGSKRNVLLSDPVSHVIHPMGCAGGRFIVFAWSDHNANKKVNMWRAEIDGSNPKQLTFGETDVAGACSSDGKWVYYQSLDSFKVFRVSIDGGVPEEVPGTRALLNLPEAGLSSDGKFLVSLRFGEDAGSTVGKVAVIPIDAGPNPEIKLLDPDQRCVGHTKFMPDAKEVVYVIHQNGTDNLWRQPLDGSRGRQFTAFDGDTIQSYSFSPDGTTLGILRSHTESDIVLLRDTALSTH